MRATRAPWPAAVRATYRPAAPAPTTATSAWIPDAAAIRRYRISIVRPIYLSHPASLEHDTGDHPERAARITAIERELQARAWLGFERREPGAVDRGLLENVHAPAHVAAIERFCAAGGGAIDIDTVASRGSM